MSQRKLTRHRKKDEVIINGVKIRVKFNSGHYYQFDSQLSRNQIISRLRVIDEHKDKAVIQHQFLPLVIREQNFYKFHMSELNGKQVAIFTPKIRPIAEIAHSDAAIYTWYASLLATEYEKALQIYGIQNVPTAYRKGQGSNIEAAKEVFDFVAKLDSAWVIKGDFKSFFDTLNHSVLKQSVAKLVVKGQRSRLPNDWYVVLSHLMRYTSIDVNDIPESMLLHAEATGRYVESVKELGNAISSGVLKVKKHTGEGIPQGTTMSATLANVYMLGFDRIIHKMISQLDGTYRRYSDDFVIVLPGNVGVERAKKIMHQIIEISNRSAKLQIEPKKTKLLFFDNFMVSKFNVKTNSWERTAFDYLGFVFTGKKVLLRTKSLLKFSRKSRRSVRSSVFLSKQLDEHKLKFKKQSKERHLQMYEFYLRTDTNFSFAGYAHRAQKIFSHSSQLYDVVINKQANKMIQNAQKYFGLRRLMFSNKTCNKHHFKEK